MTFAAKYGPWALVAGASDGVGAAFAEGIAERGVNVVLLARRQAVLDDVAKVLAAAERAQAAAERAQEAAQRAHEMLRKLNMVLPVVAVAFAVVMLVSRRRHRHAVVSAD